MRLTVLAIFFMPAFAIAQTNDSSRNNTLFLNDPASITITYKKPVSFSFITHIPKDIVGFSQHAFARNNFSSLEIITASTAALYFADQSITNTVQDKLEDNKIVSTEQFSPFLKIKIAGKPTNIGKLPKNINTFFYDLGQGSSAMVMAAAFFVTGKIIKNNRALNTANELTETFVALGVGTQLMKYATGRENPTDASIARGRWRPFPKWSDFQNHKTKYDAFPSGHLSTFISAITIVGENYPEKRWIKPVGYSIAGLCGLAMINNGVHWSSDFPLAIALGHGYGKYISKKARLQIVAR